MTLPWRGLAVFGLIALIVVVWQAADPRAQVLFSRPVGSITSTAQGELLGVSIGDEEGATLDRLRGLGFHDPDVYPGGGDLYAGGRMIDPSGKFLQILPSQTVIVFPDDGWRNGLVQLLVEHGEVIRIDWVYYGPFYLPL